MKKKEKITAEEAVDMVTATFAIEDMALDQDDKDRIRRQYSGEITEEEAVREAIEQVMREINHGG